MTFTQLLIENMSWERKGLLQVLWLQIKVYCFSIKWSYVRVSLMFARVFLFWFGT